MRISLLREFIFLSENLNFSKTAEHLYISESTLSKHISLLEQEIGAILFNRNHHKVELTLIGKVFLNEALGIVERYDAGIRTVQNALKELTKEIRVGYLSAQFKENLISCIPDFTEKYPNVDLTLIDGEYGELFQKLSFDDIDVLLILDFEKEISRNYNVYHFGTDILCAAIRYDNPLAKNNCISLNDLHLQRILLPEARVFKGFASFLQKLLNEKFLKQNQVISYNRMTSALLLVESDDCIAIIPNKLKNVAGKNIKFIPLKGEEYIYDVIAIWKNKNHNQLIYEFVQTLSNYVKLNNYGGWI